MPLTVYCTQDNLEAIWSAFGVSVRADDGDAHSSTTYVNSAIEKATTDVNLYLFQVYTPAVVAASTWVRWCTAMLACVALARRRMRSIVGELVVNADPEVLHRHIDRRAEWTRAVESTPIAPRNGRRSSTRFAPCMPKGDRCWSVRGRSAIPSI